jgi:hypothetical protein
MPLRRVRRPATAGDIQHEEGGFMMRPRTLLLLALAALAGAATAVLPALAAAPSEAKLEVAQNCHVANWPCWNPVGNPESNVPESAVPPFKIAQGGTISFEDNDAGAPTDVIWMGPARPTSCIGVVEAPPTKTGWKGTCTFSTAGEYEFESEGLFKNIYSNYTKYKVIVETAGGGGGTTSTTTTTTTIPTTTTPTTTTSPASLESPLAGSESQAVKVAKSQRGRSVKGSLQISKAGGGDRLEVDLLATAASLAKAGHATRVVGRFVSSSVSAGQRPFSVKLNAKARRALKRHHRLALKVKITLTPASGEALTITRSVVQHP